MESSNVEVLRDVDALVARAQAVVCAEFQAAIAQHDRFTLALSGGSTPKPLYESLSQQNLPWDRMHVFWGDERYVPPTHADSNEGMARRAWLDRIAIPADRIHPVPTQTANPAESAQLYEQELYRFFGADEIPALDLILLGLGDDGHTASLFPQTEVLNVCDHLIGVGYRGPDPRITFTIALINRARCVLFLVAGQNKRPALKAIFSDNANSFDYPARFIRPEGRLIWLLDEAAAEGLQSSSTLT
jgi:6-phosphogluconolactonase